MAGRDYLVRAAHRLAPFHELLRNAIELRDSDNIVRAREAEVRRFGPSTTLEDHSLEQLGGEIADQP